MKTILLAVLLMGCGSATTPAADGCMRPDGVYLVTETRFDGTCNNGIATPTPIFFDGWRASHSRHRLHAGARAIHRRPMRSRRMVGHVPRRARTLARFVARRRA